jgi:hypothetical protein
MGVVNAVTDKQIAPASSIGGRGIDLAAPVTNTTRVRRHAAVRSEFVTSGESASMLRVMTERQGDRYSLDLHGTLGGEWVAVLDQHWRSIKADVPSAKLTLVLSNVDYIDPLGEQLLRRLADDNVEFVVAGCMNRYVIDRLKPGVPDPEGRMATRGADAREARALISSPRLPRHGRDHRASL